eukprot:329475-Pleurochrysis_carterae.AAC.1
MAESFTAAPARAARTSCGVTARRSPPPSSNSDCMLRIAYATRVMPRLRAYAYRRTNCSRGCNAIDGSSKRYKLVHYTFTRQAVANTLYRALTQNKGYENALLSFASIITLLKKCLWSAVAM